jgi:hypothetical protein
MRLSQITWSTVDQLQEALADSYAADPRRTGERQDPSRSDEQAGEAERADDQHVDRVARDDPR